MQEANAALYDVRCADRLKKGEGSAGSDASPALSAVGIDCSQAARLHQDCMLRLCANSRPGRDGGLPDSKHRPLLSRKTVKDGQEGNKRRSGVLAFVRGLVPGVYYCPTRCPDRFFQAIDPPVKRTSILTLYLRPPPTWKRTTASLGVFHECNVIRHCLFRNGMVTQGGERRAFPPRSQGEGTRKKRQGRSSFFEAFRLLSTT